MIHYPNGRPPALPEARDAEEQDSPDVPPQADVPHVAEQPGPEMVPAKKSKKYAKKCPRGHPVWPDTDCLGRVCRAPDLRARRAKAVGGPGAKAALPPSQAAIRKAAKTVEVGLEVLSRLGAHRELIGGINLDKWVGEQLDVLTPQVLEFYAKMLLEGSNKEKFMAADRILSAAGRANKDAAVAAQALIVLGANSNLNVPFLNRSALPADAVDAASDVDPAIDVETVETKADARWGEPSPREVVEDGERTEFDGEGA